MQQLVSKSLHTLEYLEHMQGLYSMGLVHASRSNVYDGVKEYYVVVRESGQHVHAQEHEQNQRKRMKAPTIPVIRTKA